jgi:1-acyl-sn-glycerol-3-phosphate acyltransferase
MGFNSVEKKTVFYSILKFLVSKIFHTFYQISVDDKTDIKDGEPIIYAPNHQNALIDPLAILFTRKGQIVFLARGDIFNNKIIAQLLYMIKMLPVFRIRDGFDQLHRNQAIFDKTMDVIASGIGLGVFPEANHAGFRRLRMLKKGISRMAFQTELHYNEELNVKIIPVGMEYEHYYWFRSKVHITYGKSISVKDYIEEYKEDNPKGLNALNKAIANGIKPLMVDIQLQDEEYDAVNFLTDVNYNDKNQDLSLSFADKIKLDQDMVKKVLALKESGIDIFNTLISKVSEYKKAIDKVKTDDFSVGVIANKKSYLYFYPILFLTFPMYLLGGVLNYIPYKIPYFITRKMPDIQFHATMYFAVGGLVTVPMFYTIYLFVLKAYFGIGVALILLIGIGVLGIFSYEYFRLFVKLKRINRIKKSKNQKEVLDLRKDILSMLNSL